MFIKFKKDIKRKMYVMCRGAGFTSTAHFNKDTVIDIVEKKEKKDKKWSLEYVFEEGNNGPELWKFDLIEGVHFDIIDNPRIGKIKS